MEKKTKVAIPLFNHRVSPRFEFAPTLLVVTIENDRVLEKKEIDLRSYDLLQRSSLLRKVGIDILICGGIQGFITRSLSLTNVQVIAPVTGEAEAVLQLFLEKNLFPLFQPCCPRRALRQCQRAQYEPSPSRGNKKRNG
jgi:predicted Fe-Mo cluster-binding NifX family protein